MNEESEVMNVKSSNFDTNSEVKDIKKEMTYKKCKYSKI